MTICKNLNNVINKVQIQLGGLVKGKHRVNQVIEHLRVHNDAEENNLFTSVRNKILVANVLRRAQERRFQVGTTIIGNEEVLAINCVDWKARLLIKDETLKAEYTSNRNFCRIDPKDFWPMVRECDIDDDSDMLRLIAENVIGDYTLDPSYFHKNLVLAEVFNASTGPASKSLLKEYVYSVMNENWRLKLYENGCITVSSDSVDLTLFDGKRLFVISGLSKSLLKNKCQVAFCHEMSMNDMIVLFRSLLMKEWRRNTGLEF